jgi:N-acylneuraminate cytidylyltransferase
MKIAIIPARGGSKRIKDKNIREFCGKPMIQYALEAARDSGIFDKIHVSTESDTIRAIVEGLGYPVDFLRSAELADDVTGLMPVLQWVLGAYRVVGRGYEDVCCLMPACPLLEPEDLRRGYDRYLAFGRKHPLHVVAPFPVPIEWAYRRDGQGRLTPTQPGMFAVRSQDLEKTYYESGPFSFFHRHHLLSENPAGDEDFVSIVLPRERAIDIDDPEDLVLAETLFYGKMIRSRPELLKQLSEGSPIG